MKSQKDYFLKVRKKLSTLPINIKWLFIILTFGLFLFVAPKIFSLFLTVVLPFLGISISDKVVELSFLIIFACWFTNKYLAALEKRKKKI